MLLYKTTIWLWICCACCLFRNTQMSTAAAGPFDFTDEYNILGPSSDLDMGHSEVPHESRSISKPLLEVAQERKSASRHDQLSGSSVSSAADAGMGSVAANDNASDLQPHEQAEACSSHGHKYTHGQKVPRQDPCEVCLCIDGEIFCWWEKCSKKTLSERQPTMMNSHLHQQASERHAPATVFTARRESHNKDKRVEMPPDGNANEHLMNQQQQRSAQPKKHKLTAQPFATQSKKKHRQKQQQARKYVKIGHVEAAAPPKTTSKILSFPKNLPSVLYYDYKTEEHQSHQHEHHQQHLKHQRQQQLQRKYEQQPFSQNGKLHTKTTTKYGGQQRQRQNNENRNGNDNDIYDVIETDSDILPVPPTKMPKPLPPSTDATTKTAVTDLMQPYRSDDNWLIGDASKAKQNMAGIMGNQPYNDGDLGRERDINEKLLTASNERLETSNGQTRSGEDQDEAFHRWLTSSETKNASYGYSLDKENISTLAASNSTDIQRITVQQRKNVTARIVVNAFNGNSSSIFDKEASLSLLSPTATAADKAKMQTNATATAAAGPATAERQCNVMGTLYKIGDVLPQDTGNCLQCICIDGSTSDDTPRITCSPHNCPPLVLPDLFDATGY